MLWLQELPGYALQAPHDVGPHTLWAARRHLSPVSGRTSLLLVDITWPSVPQVPCLGALAYSWWINLASLPQVPRLGALAYSWWINLASLPQVPADLCMGALAIMLVNKLGSSCRKSFS